MKPFHELTTRGKGRRLHWLALAALQRYDLAVTRLRLLYNLWNCVFRVDTAAGEKYVIRINRPGERTRPEVQSELAWLTALHHDTDLRVPHPLMNRSGEWVTEATAPGVPESRLCSVFAWMPGPPLAQRLTPAAMEQFGTLSARLHHHAATFNLPPGCALKAFDTVFPGVEPVVVFEGLYSEQFSPEDRAAMREAVVLTERRLEQLAATDETRRVLHGDLIGWNIKVWRGQLCPLDFEGMTLGYPIQDIGISLLHTFFPAYESDALAAFRRGYERVLPWPERYSGELALWMMWRALTLANLFVQSPDPEEQSWVPCCVIAMKRHLNMVQASL
jgi:Ser/Thr protein kinase RdoA (MazF antagonist)